ncbi:hypothetical protein LF599_17495 [Pseudodesulfovibrio thermohalotolerans]|uniref:hypothetical protein n=1 Tax=Pseudodesulfovibrio thermohalotolerans TaxID=2880651 RepID=UPI0024416147|nr:hypothetical protein [Pseudodesulfovibrio thermohalotolerans]WFS62431.1 hypothetical protein LF599_17495 [Pseudodesulfovibrio thermohalotolerans]
MLLDVPFLPDNDYVAFLLERSDRLASVHFSLCDPRVSDARQRTAPAGLDAIITGLNRLPGVDKLLLMNSRFLHPERYFDIKLLDETADLLDRLTDEAGLTGIVFADAYFLQALSDARPETCKRLAAVPSINAMPDSPARVFALLDMIDQTAFRPPTRLVADRALNRDPDGLNSLAHGLRARHKDIRLFLMANEGCLYQCPYKPAHDAHVGLVVEGLCGDRTFAMNRDFGCVRRMIGEPGLMLASPFIRPEDAWRYKGIAHGLKLCGRNRGAAFLLRAADAYVQGRYDGNLLDLMDAMGDLADRVRIPNRSLPADFFERVTACDKACRTCGLCASLAERIAERVDPGLPAYRP